MTEPSWDRYPGMEENMEVFEWGVDKWTDEAGLRMWWNETEEDEEGWAEL